MLIKYSGKYVKIYFNMKITYLAFQQLVRKGLPCSYTCNMKLKSVPKIVKTKLMMFYHFSKITVNRKSFTVHILAG